MAVWHRTHEGGTVPPPSLDYWLLLDPLDESDTDQRYDISLPLMYNPHGITFLISVLVMFTGRLCCVFGDLTKWSSLCVITTPSEVWPVLRTFGIALVNLAHFTHRVWIRVQFLPVNVIINLAPSQLEITIPDKLVWLKSHHTQRARPVPRSQSA